jgi:hypothetical protein
MDKQMDTWTIVSVIVTIIGGVVSGALWMAGNIDRKIEQKVNDPNFIKKLADEVKLPFLIFDEDNRVIADYGAYEYLQKISVVKSKQGEVEAIRITPKHFMNTPPILENINGDLNLAEPERADQVDWVISIKPGPARLLLQSHVEPVKKFKLTILR